METTSQHQFIKILNAFTKEMVKITKPEVYVSFSYKDIILEVQFKNYDIDEINIPCASLK